MADAAASTARLQDVLPKRVRWRSIALLAAALLLSVLMYGAGVLMPYYATELHRLPLVDGVQDWPDTVLVYLAAVFGPLLLPLTATAGVGLGALWLAVLWRRPGPQPALKASVLLLVVAASTAVLLFPLSELGRALAVWRAD